MKKIVLLSHTPRDSVFKVGSYHISRILAQKGYEILYIASPLSLAHLLWFLFKPRKWRELKNRLKYIKIRRDDEGVFNYTPLLLFPYIGTLKWSRVLYEKFNLDLSFTGRQIERAGFSTSEWLLLDALKLDVLSKHFECKKYIYRATDIYTEMSGANGMVELESEVVNKADMVIATSNPLKFFLKKNYGVDASVLVNGVDYEHFNTPRTKPVVYEHISSPIFIYIGSFDDRFDFSQVRYFQKRKDLSLVLIGPVEDESTIPPGDNIHVLGKIDYKDIPAYLQHADVGILPLKLIEANHGRSPMKLYEFAAAGLPIVSPKLREIVGRGHEFISHYDVDEDSMEKTITDVLQKRGHLTKIAIKEARKYSWERQIDSLIQMLNKNE